MAGLCPPNRIDGQSAKDIDTKDAELRMVNQALLCSRARV